ncbi:MAG: hypothetical protein U0V72_14625 [Cytophagales bacterium]
MKYKLKKSFWNVLNEQKVIFIFIFILGMGVSMFNDYKLIGMFFFIIEIFFILFTFIKLYRNCKVTLDYICTYEYHMIKNHNLETINGPRAYFLDFNEQEIETLLNSKVKNEFIECYNLKANFLYPLLVFGMEYIIIEIVAR